MLFYHERLYEQSQWGRSELNPDLVSLHGRQALTSGDAESKEQDLTEEVSLELQEEMSTKDTKKCSKKRKGKKEHQEENEEEPTKKRQRSRRI